jgi:Xaa-Pro aminopeptidase
MPSLNHYQHRRNQVLDAIEHPLLLMAGGWMPRNYPQNPYPYRADSNFLFLLADPEPDSAALLDPGDRSVTLFLPRRTPQDALWHGPVPSFAEVKERHGVNRVLPRDELAERVRELARDRPVSALAVADPEATRAACEVTGQDLAFADPSRQGPKEVVMALGRLRMVKEDEEIAEMRRTAAVTKDAHLLAITHTRPGIYEQDLAGLVDGCFARHGCVPAYNTILSVRGEVLHNHSHDNVLRDADIVLLDAGAENRSGYCSDVTRSWPVGGRFDAEGREIYDIVLRAQLAAIEAVAPGARYRDIHRTASRVIAEGLVELGLLRGNPDDLVEAGAHALFFPHGVGHLVGLDVHDMEAFGDAISYAPGRTRSAQFGLSYLRLDVDLEPGIAVTIEPGIYFVPAILREEGFRAQFAEQVDFARAEGFLTMHGLRGFGGIRIEDDVLCTRDGHEVLTAAIPKERAIIEAMVGCAR